ncbi:MAG: hypothetical protein JWO62_2766 [Acidimicrobiaceae bacterium]|nr:hypothetical protein [Acidimicrobiaceae bacterium]
MTRRPLATLTTAIVTLLSLGLGSQAKAATLPASSQGAAASGAFSWLRPGPPPSGWRRLALPSGAAVLSFPPSLRPIKGDKTAVSAALIGHHGDFLAYLNATPQEGNEHLAGWAGSRIEHLREDDASSAHEDAAAEGLAFRGGHGSCVIDDYVTKVGHHPFREIACLVEGARGGSVIVAAAPPSTWSHVGATLQRAVSSYLLR